MQCFISHDFDTRRWYNAFSVLGPTGLLSKKTRILVTNAVTYLPFADQILVLKDGKISETGTYKELIAKEGEFAEFINTHASKENGTGEEEEEEEDSEEGEEEEDVFAEGVDSAASKSSGIN